MRSRLPPGLLRLVLLALTAAPCAAADYRYDTVHSQLIFNVDHNGYSHAFGRLRIAHGWLRFDAKDWSHAATEADIDLASLDMGEADWSEAVRARAFLNASGARFAHFASTSLERTDADHGLLHGQLTLRGITRPVDLKLTFNRQGRTVYGLHEVVGFSATTMLDRTNFGMTSHPYAIGRDAVVWLEIEAIRDDQAAPPTSESDHAPAQ